VFDMRTAIPITADRSCATNVGLAASRVPPQARASDADARSSMKMPHAATAAGAGRTLGRCFGRGDPMSPHPA